MTLAAALPLALFAAVIVGGAWLLGLASERWPAATFFAAGGAIGLVMAALLVRGIVGLLGCLCR